MRTSSCWDIVNKRSLILLNTHVKKTLLKMIKGYEKYQGDQKNSLKMVFGRGRSRSSRSGLDAGAASPSHWSPLSATLRPGMGPSGIMTLSHMMLTSGHKFSLLILCLYQIFGLMSVIIMTSGLLKIYQIIIVSLILFSEQCQAFDRSKSKKPPTYDEL